MHHRPETRPQSNAMPARPKSNAQAHGPKSESFAFDIVVNRTKVTYIAPPNGLSYTGLIVDSFPYVTGSTGKGFVTQWCFKVRFADNSHARWYRQNVSLATADAELSAQAPP